MPPKTGANSDRFRAAPHVAPRRFATAHRRCWSKRRPQWTAVELAGRLEVTDRTLRRDIERLRVLGYPVYSARGVAGGYRLGAGSALPPLLLDDEEATAVVIALRTAAIGGVTGIAETAVSALAKLEQVLPARLRHRIASLQQATVLRASTTTIGRWRPGGQTPYEHLRQKTTAQTPVNDLRQLHMPDRAAGLPLYSAGRMLDLV
jgi:hypothetical protein